MLKDINPNVLYFLHFFILIKKKHTQSKALDFKKYTPFGQNVSQYFLQVANKLGKFCKYTNSNTMWWCQSMVTNKVER